MNKYRNKKIETPDGRFDSKKEYLRYCALKLMEQSGEITELKRQVPFELIAKHELHHPVMRKGKNHFVESACKYWADFTYMKNGQLIVEDAKGVATAEYILKRKLMLDRYDIQIEEV